MAAGVPEFKLVLIGDGGVGKTTFVKRHTTGYVSTSSPFEIASQLDTLRCAGLGSKWLPASDRHASHSRGGLLHSCTPLYHTPAAPVFIFFSEFERRYVATVGAEVNPMDFVTTKGPVRFLVRVAPNVHAIFSARCACHNL